jgi:predicted component of type VI protein secretion system
MVRAFVGAELDFDVQAVLKAGEIPACRLGGGDGYEPLLGWTTWLVAAPAKRDFEGAVFPSKEV